MVPIFASRRNEILGLDFMGPFSTVELWNNSQRLNAIIRSNLAAAHEKQKTNYDKSVKDSRIFALGDAVKLINYSKKIGKSACFQDKFLGRLGLLITSTLLIR